MAALLAGCGERREVDFFPDEPSVRVVTYNVNWGFANPQEVVLFLDSADADVVCLQETHAAWEAYLKSALGKRYPYRVFEDRGGAGGIAIMSKQHIGAVEVLEAEEGWFPALLATVDTAIGPVQFLNVHLKPPLNEGGSASASALYNAGGVHLEEIQGFVRSVDQGRPVVIAGDFNENDDGRAVQWLVEQGYMDSLRAFDSYGKTWRWELSYGLALQGRYDHIMIGEGLGSTGAALVEVDASDHRPVVAEVVAVPGF
jgi:endonuclease/exonuclease/phosphatase (EEP) superfamily protein YafD